MAGKEGIMDMNRLGNLGIVQTDISAQPARKAQQEKKGTGLDFQTMLQERAGDSLNFSKHAAKRLEERGIDMDSRLMNDLENAVEGARKKGARELAVIGAKGVFIVNVPNNVVVTTMSQEDMKQRVFTNIDSAVLM